MINLRKEVLLGYVNNQTQLRFCCFELKKLLQFNVNVLIFKGNIKPFK